METRSRGPGANGDQARPGAPMNLQKGAPPGHSRRERERLHCRQEILSAASELFAQFGYEKTAVKQIAERVGVSVGALYSHFQGKEDIFRELLENWMRDMRRRSDAACRAEDPPLEQLRCRLAAATEHFKEHIDFLTIYHNENPMLLEGMIRAEIERNSETASKLIRGAMDRGDIARADPDVLAAVLIGSVQELMHMFAQRGRRDDFDDIPGIVERLIFKPLETKRMQESGMEGR